VHVKLYKHFIRKAYGIFTVHRRTKWLVIYRHKMKTVKKIYRTAAIFLYPITTLYKILSKQNSQSFPRPITIKHLFYGRKVSEVSVVSTSKVRRSSTFYRLQAIKNSAAIGVSFKGTTLIPRFVNIGQLVHKLIFLHSAGSMRYFSLHTCMSI
jgi:hypothetical protein